MTPESGGPSNGASIGALHWAIIGPMGAALELEREDDIMKTGIWHAGDVLSRVRAIPEDREQYVEPARHGTMSLGMYAPRGEDDQEPHDQDELYVVLSGSGRFVHGGESSEFGPGDALFVAAGVEHRFENFSDDFAAWVIFWGPEGGESA